jgi:hypothetical protein
MSSIYHVNLNKAKISIKVDVSTIGSCAISIKKFRKGNSINDIVVSKPNNNGNIARVNIGTSDELIGSTILVTAAVIFTATQNIQQAFDGFRMEANLSGGLDGPQIYEATKNDKTLFSQTRSMVATIAIKLQSVINDL